MPIQNWIIPSPDGTAATIPNHRIGLWISSNPDAIALRPIIDTLHISTHAKLAHMFLKSGSGPKILPALLKDHEYFCKHIWEQLQLAADSDSLGPIKRSKRRIPRYRFTFDLTLEGTLSKPLICFPGNYGGKKPVPALLFILNIDQLGGQGLIQLEQVWNSLVGNLLPFRSLLLDSRITRLDTAIDVLNVSPPDLYMHNEKLWKIWAVHDPTMGLQTTQYYLVNKNKVSPFSSPKNRSDLIVYDKRAEQLANHKQPRFGSIPHTRIERSQRAITQVSKILELKPNFDGWTVMRADVIAGKTQAEWRRFLDSLRVRGFGGASALHEGMPAKPAELSSLAPQDVLVPKLLENWDGSETLKAVHLLSEWANLSPQEAFGHH